MIIDRVDKVRNAFVYLALFVECVAVVVDKSRVTIPFTTYLFRGTAAVFLLCLLMTEYTVREWAVIAIAIALGITSYLYTGRDEIVRVALLVAACKPVPLKRSLGLCFWVTLTGCIVIAALSITGLFGELSVTQLYRLEDGVTTRMTLGFGHPNALHCMYYMLLLMALYLFDRYLKWYWYVLLAASNVGMYLLTDSRTGLLLGLFSVGLAVLFHYPPQIDTDKDEVARFQAERFGREYLDRGLRANKGSYAMGMLAVLSSVGFSVLAAACSFQMWYYGLPSWLSVIYRIDSFINTRITNLYWTDSAHAGSIETWTILSSRDAVQFFDMGWVRLFYWYGILPAALAVLCILLLILYCYKRRDGQALTLIISLSIYTIIEAHLISIYLGRNFLLLLFGAYWGGMLHADKGERYFLPELVMKRSFS